MVAMVAISNRLRNNDKRLYIVFIIKSQKSQQFDIIPAIEGGKIMIVGAIIIIINIIFFKFI